MTKATELSSAIFERLQAISVANGYSLDIPKVYGFGENKPDSVKPPFLLLRIGEDRTLEIQGQTATRQVSFEIDGCLSRAASLADLQKLHHDIVRAIGSSRLPHIRPLKSGWVLEESTEYDPDQNGSNVRSLTTTITLQYVETY